MQVGEQQSLSLADLCIAVAHVVHGVLGTRSHDPFDKSFSTDRAPCRYDNLTDHQRKGCHQVQLIDLQLCIHFPLFDGSIFAADYRISNFELPFFGHM